MISFFIQTEGVCYTDGIIFCDWITAVVVKIYNWNKKERDEKITALLLGFILNRRIVILSQSC